MNDVWTLALSGKPTWSKLSPSGIKPAARSFHTATYDPMRDRMIVFGGGGNDVWALSLGSPLWSQLAPTGVLPAARTEHSAIYDPLRDRLVVFSGGGDAGGFPAVFGDLWTLSWTPPHMLVPTSGPSGAIHPDAPIIVPEGGSSTFTIEPNTDYHVADVQVDGVSVG